MFSLECSLSLVCVFFRCQNFIFPSPLDWDSRISKLHHCKRSKTSPPPNECPNHNTKLSYGETPVLELWGKRNIYLLSLLPVPDIELCFVTVLGTI